MTTIALTRTAVARTIGLTRVSTEEQSTDGQTLQIRRWAETQSPPLDVEFRSEDGVSGVATERPVLDAIVAELAEGDCLVVVALDRLGRSTLRVVALLDDLHKRGVRVVSLRESLDMATPFGKFAAVILAAVAELERGMIVARTRRGMAAAKARGAPVGNPPLVWPPEADELLLRLKAEKRSNEWIAASGGILCERVRVVDASGEPCAGTEKEPAGRKTFMVAPSLKSIETRLAKLRKG